VLFAPLARTILKFSANNLPAYRAEVIGTTIRGFVLEEVLPT
jgi:hypothetical protein